MVGRFCGFILLFVIVFFSRNACSSEQETEILKSKLNESLPDTQRIELLNQLGWAYKYKDPDSSRLFIDQALSQEKKSNWEKGRAVSLRYLGGYFLDRSEFDSALYYYNRSLQLCREISFEEGTGSVLGNIGIVYVEQGMNEKALDFYKRALRINHRSGNVDAVAKNLGNIGNVYKHLSEPDKALEYHLAALKINLAAGNTGTAATNYANIGNVYRAKSDLPGALEFYLKALAIHEKSGNKHGSALTHGNIALVYADLGKNEKALQSYSEAIALDESVGNKSGVARHLGSAGNIYKELAKGQGRDSAVRLHRKALENYQQALEVYRDLGIQYMVGMQIGNMGIVYNDLGEKEKALEHYREALKIMQESGSPEMVASNAGNIAALYLSEGRLNEAEPLLRMALELDQSTGSLWGLKYRHKVFSELYDSMAARASGREKTRYVSLAYDHYKNYIAMRDSLNNSEQQNAIIRLEMNHNFEKKQAIARTQHEKEMALAEEEKKRQRVIIWSGGGGILLLAGFIFLTVNRLRITRKQKRVIERQKILVEEQKELVISRNKEITDSINYARRIQDSILPSAGTLKENLPDGFVLYRPKDIVSGDFYWVERVGDKVFVAVADCTGHGVPGAMVSVVCANALSKSLLEEKITEPGRMLDRARELVVARFAGNLSRVRDGMDIALCTFEVKASEEPVTLQFSGANNSLWVIRQGEHKDSNRSSNGFSLFEYKGDKQPVGAQENPKPFSTTEVSIKKGDLVYMFSDGFADQFGGLKGKKLKTAGLKDLILSVSHLSMENQKKSLEEAFDIWKADLEQVDDVCIVGFRIIS